MDGHINILVHIIVMAVQITHVAMEHHREAMGIGESQSRVSWRFTGSTENWIQSSYDIEILNPDTPNLPAESFSVNSRESFLVHGQACRYPYVLHNHFESGQGQKNIETPHGQIIFR